MSLISPLKHKHFRHLFSGQVCSDLANWLDFLALNSLIVYHWGLGVEAIAPLLIALGLPWVVIGPIASVWTHRFSPKMLLIVCNAIRLFIVLCLIWAPHLYILLALVFLKGVFSSIFDPVKQSLIRYLIPASSLAEASSLSQLSVNLTKILAPALGGLILAVLGLEAAFLGSAILYGFSTLFLILLPLVEIYAEETKHSFWQSIKEGWMPIQTNTLLSLSVILMTCSMFLTFLYDGLFILFTKSMGFGESGLGILMSAVGLGSVLGALAIGQKTSWKHNPLFTMIKAGLFSGGIVILIGLGNMGIIGFYPLLWYVLFFLLGYNGARATVPFGYILQSHSPVHLIGRITATTNAILTGAMLAAPAMGAMLAGIMGLGPIFITAGFLKTLLAIIFLLWVRRKRLSTANCTDNLKAM